MKRCNSILLHLFVLAAPALAQLDPVLKWDYPVKLGTEAWKSLKNVDERVEACQINPSLLKSLSNEDLIHIIMEHPFFRSYIAHDSPKTGINSAIGHFNGYQELVSRPNAIQNLAKVYFSEDFDSKLSSIEDTIQQAKYTLKWIGVELMMTNDKLLGQLSTFEKTEFLKKLYNKHLNKQEHLASFGEITNLTTAYISNKLLEMLSYVPAKDVSKQPGADLFESRMIVTAESVNLINDMIDNLAEFVANN